MDILDYRDVIGPLSDPASYGGDAADAFDLIIPSLPGFGFSSPLRTTGIDVPAIARLWVKLMAALGYDRFAAGGGDWGAAITSQLGHAHGEQLIGVYHTMITYPGLDYGALKANDFAPDEQWMIERNQVAAPLSVSHVSVNSHDPQTLAYALVDSPVGTAAWLWERRRAWSDCGGDVTSVFDRDFLCTTASIYWLTGTLGSAARLYFEHFKRAHFVPPSHDRLPVIAVPAGYAVFPREMVLAPRSVVAAHTNLQRWTIFPKGGHFGPAEQPDAVTDELRAFFRPLRGEQPPARPG